jgi:hypothetical protein
LIAPSVEGERREAMVRGSVVDPIGELQPSLDQAS